MSKSLLSSQWLGRLSQFKTLVVGFSGGLDSTVLLHVLASYPSLKSRIKAVHINHSISPNASAWQTHCEQFCLSYDIESIVQSVQFDCSANIEDRARQARYAVFKSLIGSDDALLLAHHQDDQAETVLLQLVRGAGVDGLAAMSESCFFAEGALIRPFLSHSRKHLEHYASEHQLTWVEDESNQDINYSRNFLRQKVMPLLVEKWPGVVGNLAQAALHCQQAKANLEELACLDLAGDLPNASCNTMIFGQTLPIDSLISLSFDRLANVLRLWLKKNQTKPPSTKTFRRLYEEVILARYDAMPCVSWGDVQVRRYQKTLFLEKNNVIGRPNDIEWHAFPNPLGIPVLSIGLSAIKSSSGLKVSPGARVQVRFRQGGETMIWRGQTKELKKLMQDWKIAPWLRDRWPLIYIDDQLAAVVGLAISDLFFSQTDAWAILSTPAD